MGTNGGPKGPPKKPKAEFSPNRASKLLSTRLSNLKKTTKEEIKCIEKRYKDQREKMDKRKRSKDWPERRPLGAGQKESGKGTKKSTQRLHRKETFRGRGRLGDLKVEPKRGEVGGKGKERDQEQKMWTKRKEDLKKEKEKKWN